MTGAKPPEKRSLRPCGDCGLALHAHDRRRVYTEGGRYHYRLECPQ